MRSEEFLQRLAEELSAREMSRAEMRHKEDAVTGEEKLIEQVKQLSASASEMDSEVINSMGTVADSNVKLAAV